MFLYGMLNLKSGTVYFSMACCIRRVEVCFCMACCTGRVVLCTLVWHAALGELKCVSLYGMLYWKSGTVCFSMACCIRRVEVCFCMAC